jgi:hypothetical protein
MFYRSVLKLHLALARICHRAKKGTGVKLQFLFVTQSSKAETEVHFE